MKEEMHQCAVSVNTKEGVKNVLVQGYLILPFMVHRPLVRHSVCKQRKSGKFIVTHIPSGLAILTDKDALFTQKQGIEFAQALPGMFLMLDLPLDAPMEFFRKGLIGEKAEKARAALMDLASTIKEKRPQEQN